MNFEQWWNKHYSLEHEKQHNSFESGYRDIERWIPSIRTPFLSKDILEKIIEELGDNIIGFKPIDYSNHIECKNINELPSLFGDNKVYITGILLCGGLLIPKTDGFGGKHDLENGLEFTSPFLMIYYIKE